MSLYGKLQYWEDRYTRNTQPFDWYQRFNAFKQYTIAQIPKKTLQSKILIVGCGNSRLAEQMVQEGYQTIYNIDISIACTKNMAEKYKEKTQKIKFQCMDARQMTYANEYFDGIIDKAMLDSMLCGQNGVQNAYKALCQIYRVLKKKGTYMMLSYQGPQKRQYLLQRNQFDWNVKTVKIPKPISNSYSYSILQEQQEQNCHYLYICTKE